METEVYGLVSGPAWWRVTFVSLFTKRGYVICPLERCVLVLPGKKPGEPTRGVALLEMDDVLEGGDSDHDDLMSSIAKDIVFGKTKRVMDEPEGVLFNGQR